MGSRSTSHFLSASIIIMRLGIYGGSFDPIHYGHLLLAESAREQCRLDQVWFLPAAVPPHKQQRELVPAHRRVEMLQLAILGHPSFLVSTIEIDRGGVSYTVDTLAAIQEQQRGDELFLLIGADALADLPTWREPARICSIATPLAVRRPDSPPLNFGALGSFLSPERLAEIERAQVEMPLIGLSSTEIRRRIADGRSIRFRVPRGVEKYIETHGLYRATAT